MALKNFITKCLPFLRRGAQGDKQPDQQEKPKSVDSVDDQPSLTQQAAKTTSAPAPTAKPAAAPAQKPIQKPGGGTASNMMLQQNVMNLTAAADAPTTCAPRTSTKTYSSSGTRGGYSSYHSSGGGYSGGYSSGGGGGGSCGGGDGGGGGGGC
ncbi:hypothetical protein ACJZ2D_009337 [Fusarium nematophilum]